MLSSQRAISRQAEQTAGAPGYSVYDHERELALQLHGEVLALNRLDGHPTAAMNRIYGARLAVAVRQALVPALRELSAPASPAFAAHVAP